MCPHVHEHVHVRAHVHEHVHVPTQVASLGEEQLSLLRAKFTAKLSEPAPGDGLGGGDAADGAGPEAAVQAALTGLAKQLFDVEAIEEEVQRLIERPVEQAKRPWIWTCTCIWICT